MNRLLACIPALALLIGCDPTMDKVTEPPELLTTAPDGTKLWRAHVNGEGPVYFSSQGASWETREGEDGNGNGHTVKHTTPNTKHSR